jgi:hypothetical protein
MPEIEEIPPDSSVEDVYKKLACTEEDIMTLKTLDLGWKNLQPHDAPALELILSKAANVVNLKCASPRLPSVVVIGRCLVYLCTLLLAPSHDKLLRQLEARLWLLR